MNRGAAKDRITSVNGLDMGHRRKPSSSRSNGYEMHIMIVIDLVTFVVVTPGNKPDAEPFVDMMSWTNVKQMESSSRKRWVIRPTSIGRLSEKEPSMVRYDSQDAIRTFGGRKIREEQV
jgi:hypothetical protein